MHILNTCFLVHYRSFTVEYFNFSGQAKLWNKNLMDDRREALGYEPCERCRLRGGRCAKCKAIRTGGGYIILDENDLSDDELRRKFGNRKAIMIIIRYVPITIDLTLLHRFWIW